MVISLGSGPTLFWYIVGGGMVCMPTLCIPVLLCLVVVWRPDPFCIQYLFSDPFKSLDLPKIIDGNCL